jgi:hypothetical protein
VLNKQERETIYKRVTFEAVNISQFPPNGAAKFEISQGSVASQHECAPTAKELLGECGRLREQQQHREQSNLCRALFLVRNIWLGAKTRRERLVGN